MAKIGGLRTWEKRPRGVQYLVLRQRKRFLALYGREDVPSYVRNVVADRARTTGVTLREALEALIREAGSFKALKRNCRKLANATLKKHKRERERAASSYRPTVFNNVFTRVSIVQGGAPGLGGVRKPMRIGK